MSSDKRIDEASGIACHSGLQIFHVPPTDGSIKHSGWRELLPMNSMNSESPWEFRHFSDNQWIDLCNTYIYFLLTLEKKNGNKWDPIAKADTDVGSIQSIGQSIIQSIKLHLNGIEVFSESMYPYMCYIKNMLSFSEDLRQTELASQGYYTDTEDMNSSTNPGFSSRVELFAEGKYAEFLAKVEFDLANQDHFMLNNTDVVFTFYKTDDDFLVHTLKPNDANTYRFKVEKVKMYVKTVDIQPSINLEVLSVLNKASAKYALRKTEMRSCYISPGRTELTHNIFTNVVPRRLVIGLVNNKAYKGDKTLTPYKFEPFDVRSVSVEACGQTYPAVRYDLRFNDNKNPEYVRAFLDLHKGVNLARKNISNGITLKKFASSFTLFVIPLTASLEDNPGFELVKNGTTTIKLTFNTKIVDPGVALIALGEFDQLLSIDTNRVVATDGSV